MAWFRAENRGYLYAILAAILFGASTPAAKFLIGQTHPWLLAGLLYLGSASGLTIIFIVQRFFKTPLIIESPISGSDWKWLAIAIVLGGILGPVLLMFGLEKITGSAASLLLNLESVFTALIAWLVFKEFVDKKLAFGMLLIVVGGCILAWTEKPHLDDFLGILYVAGACLLWSIDNNLTRKISASDPLQIALIKSLIAGLTNTLCAFIWIGQFPLVKTVALTSLVGFLGYGVSLYCYILGLRYIGAARTGAYFSIAPFVGALLAIIFLHESLSSQFILASIFMGIGIWLHLSEYHAHEHLHEELEHAHKHTHDEHHQHEHLPSDPKGEPHTHWHKHAKILHSHPHYPDIHHRHKH